MASPESPQPTEHPADTMRKEGVPLIRELQQTYQEGGWQGVLRRGAHELLHEGLQDPINAGDVVSRRTNNSELGNLVTLGLRELRKFIEHVGGQKLPAEHTVDSQNPQQPK
jgi:hypothetical protein